MSSTDGLAQLSGVGVSIWLDDLSREMMTSGQLDRLIKHKHLVGVTTNPTIFAKALSESAAYNEHMVALAARGADVDTALREITTSDVRDAADAFRDVHTQTDGVDGRVSIEVDPRLAHQTDNTVAQALDLWKTVDRRNIFVKIPATQAGLPAITRTLAEGVCVNVTLIFSLERYREVIEAFFAGLERARANGYELAEIHSVASFFVSRVDAEVDKRLESLGTSEAHQLRGKAAIANARLAYALFEEMFATKRWQALRDAGANPQRPLWASTGVKNADYSPTRYVDELVVAGTVNTMPDQTMDEVEANAKIVGDTVSGTKSRSQEVFDNLSAAGVDLDDVYRVLEEQGVEKFEKSWNELSDTIGEQLNASR